MSVNIFTNEGENSLLNKLNGVFENRVNLYAFHAVVGYFRASGYFAVREHLMKVPDVKILVGIDIITLQRYFLKIIFKKTFGLISQISHKRILTKNLSW